MKLEQKRWGNSFSYHPIYQDQISFIKIQISMRSNCASARLSWQQHGINDVNHTIVGSHISRCDGGIIHLDAMRGINF